MENSFINVNTSSDFFDLYAGQPDQTGYFTRGGSTTIIESGGVLSSLGTTDAASQGVSNGTGHAIRQNTGGLAGDTAYLSRSVNFSYAMKVFYRYKFALGQTANMRFFGGTTDVSLGLITGDSAINSMGIHYSTVRADTNFQFISQGAGSQQITDSGITADLLPHIIDVFYYPNDRVEFRLYDSEFNFQAQAVHSTEIPSSSNFFDFNFGIQTQAAFINTGDQYFGQVILKPTL